MPHISLLPSLLAVLHQFLFFAFTVGLSFASLLPRFPCLFIFSLSQQFPSSPFCSISRLWFLVMLQVKLSPLRGYYATLIGAGMCVNVLFIRPTCHIVTNLKALVSSPCKADLFPPKDYILLHRCLWFVKWRSSAIVLHEKNKSSPFSALWSESSIIKTIYKVAPQFNVMYNKNICIV